MVFDRFYYTLPRNFFIIENFFGLGLGTLTPFVIFFSYEDVLLYLFSLCHASFVLGGFMALNRGQMPQTP